MLTAVDGVTQTPYPFIRYLDIFTLLQIRPTLRTIRNPLLLHHALKYTTILETVEDHGHS